MNWCTGPFSSTCECGEMIWLKCGNSNEISLWSKWIWQKTDFLNEWSWTSQGCGDYLTSAENSQETS